MKLLVKMILVLAVVATLFAFLRPNSPVGEVIRAAIDDAGAFCDRQPEACHQGAAIAHRTSDLVAAGLRVLSGEREHEREQARDERPLTNEDRTLLPHDASSPQQPAIATHEGESRP